MKLDNHISVTQFCSYYNIPDTFINSLTQYDLISVAVKENESFIAVDTIAHIEKLMRLHYDLNVNFEGLDIITNLLTQLEEAQQEIRLLKNKLDLLDSF